MRVGILAEERRRIFAAPFGAHQRALASEFRGITHPGAFFPVAHAPRLRFCRPLRGLTSGRWPPIFWGSRTQALFFLGLTHPALFSWGSRTQAPIPSPP